MVAYSFKARFAEPILTGTKTQTIRAVRTGRSRHARPGDELQLYTGMRTKQCKLIRRAPCIAIHEVTLFFRASLGIAHNDDAQGFMDALMVGQPRWADAFARADGFTDYADMRAFWGKEHPGVDVFCGVLIRWAS